jgi:hypothetical protein
MKLMYVKFFYTTHLFFLLLIIIEVVFIYLYKNEYSLKNNNINDEDICLANNATIHTFFNDKNNIFSYLVMQESNVSIISGCIKFVEGSGRTTLLLHGGTQIYIDKALYYSKSQRNLLSFKDIRRNGYHVETTNKKCILEKLSMFPPACTMHILVQLKYILL